AWRAPRSSELNKPPAQQRGRPRPRRRPRHARRLVMVLGVMLRGLVAVMDRMQFMRMRHVGVMARLLVIARFVVLGGFTMVMRGSLVMLGRELVVAATLVRLRAHVALLSLWSIDGEETATSI